MRSEKFQSFIQCVFIRHVYIKSVLVKLSLLNLLFELELLFIAFYIIKNYLEALQIIEVARVMLSLLIQGSSTTLTFSVSTYIKLQKLMRH